MRTTTFTALGTQVVVAVDRPSDLASAERRARETLADVDQTCSRFREDSDLSRVNTRPGTWVLVDPLLVAAVEAALEAARRTDGLVNPLLGRDLVMLGYDRDLAELRALPEPDGAEAALSPDGDRRVDLLGAWQDIEVRSSHLRIPVDTALDLGSIGKAWAADLIARAWSAELSGPAAVSVGGDVAVTERAPAWPVEVLAPGSTTQHVLLHGGGMATSSTLLRRWRQAGTTRHHLLDPRTGLPVPEVWSTVTVTGPSCAAANTASTVSVVLGLEAPAWLTRHGFAARLLSPTGRATTVGGWPDEQRRTA